MQKRKFTWVFVCLAVSLFSGCAGGAETESGTENVQSEVSEKAGEEEETMEKTEMTAEQEALLVKISVNEERVRSGELYDWQIEVLNQYNYALAYLNRKYPSHSFEITDCAQKNKLNSYSTFWFQADGQEEAYELYLYAEEEEDYFCEDNFYASLIAEPYAEALLALLQKEVPECVEAVSRISSVKDETYGENLDPKDLLSGALRVTNSTDIYVDGREQDAEALAQGVRSVIEGEKIYGSYTVYVLGQFPDDSSDYRSLAEYRKENESQAVSLEESFQQFD